jgi:shikimate kinase / 3-dehydroquinate synthase
VGAALGKHVALIGFMGAGKTTVGAEVAERLGRPFVDVDRRVEDATGTTVAKLFQQSEATFRAAETAQALRTLRSRPAAVIALGGGAVNSDQIRAALRQHAVTVLLEVPVDEAWRRVRRGGRPLAQDELHFRALYEKRRPLYEACADARGRTAEDVVLAAGAVHVGHGASELLGELVPGTGPVALVADSRVAGIHGPKVQSALGERLVSSHQLPAGEDAKTLAACERLWAELSLERHGTLVALGGGATTDAAGFVAATYLRGIAWAAVPSTLVGQVDAAIGGKTAVNLPHGKNLLGAFHWPARTIIDPALLATLPADERANGMAEVVKTGLLAGQPLWELAEAELVRRCAAFKTALCLRDPYERGPRTALNLGHTFAHALEAGARYVSLPHGRAVALGLQAALRLSVEHAGLDHSVLEQVEQLLDPQPAAVDRGLAHAALFRDKKATGGTPRLVLLERPGRPLIGVELPEAAVHGALDALIAG